jgi:CRP/FNR family cyclic AMP-dependent transcriptional regulator
MTDDVSCLALMDVYGRLVRVIKNESEESTDGVRMTERMTHKELANRVGSSREMVSKILRDLREGGYIRIADHRIVLEKALPEKW